MHYGKSCTEDEGVGSSCYSLFLLGAVEYILSLNIADYQARKSKRSQNKKTQTKYKNKVGTLFAIQLRSQGHGGLVCRVFTPNKVQ